MLAGPCDNHAHVPTQSLDPLDILQLAISGGVLTAIGSAATWWTLRRKSNAESQKLEIETADTLLKRLEELRHDYLTEQDRAIVERRARVSAESELERVSGLLNALRSTRLSVRNYDHLKDTLDCARDPFFFTQLVDGEAHLTWANKAACDVLVRPLVEVLRLDWRGMIRSSDIIATEEIEARASDGAVRGHRNVFTRGDGGEVGFEWTCPSYRDNRTIAIARVQYINLPTKNDSARS
jgi:hypothetical protein